MRADARAAADSARFAEDRERNLALVEQTLARRGAALRVPVAELAKGGFQAHFDFLQRLHAYVRNERVQGRAHRKPPQASSASAQTPPQPPRAAARGDPAGASPRSPLQMAAALAEDSRFLGEERADAAPLTSAGDAHLQLTRGRELEELIASLELDIKSRVAAQRELLERVEQLSSERDFLLDRLLLVERAAADAPASPFARAVTSVLLDAQTELLSAQRPP